MARVRRKRRHATSATHSKTKPIGENAVVETTMCELVRVDGEGPFMHGGEEKPKDKQEEIHFKEEVETNPKKKLRRRKRRNNSTLGGIDSSSTQHVKKFKALVGEKDSKRVESMGLIFMCNALTKQDCFRYKVLGLPASKKKIVAKVYKGMRLFLFDIDQRLMYGIYKATEPGGYYIEPKAFKSDFPSQVRFAVLDDCLPLPEEKFKAAIKDNYYGKKKFNCVLSSDQVKNLCKLFRGGSNSKQGGGVSRKEVPSIEDGGWKRRGWDRVKDPSWDEQIYRRHPDTYERPMSPRNPDTYERPIYASPRLPGMHDRTIYPSLAPLAPPLPPPYAYAGGPVEMDYYAAKLELLERRLMELEAKPRDEVERRVPRALHHETASYHNALQPSVLPARYLPPLYRY